MTYYLGADLGATKTHILIADQTGRALAFGESGPGNHETVGYDGMFASMHDALGQALTASGLHLVCFGSNGMDEQGLISCVPVAMHGGFNGK